MFSSFGSCFWLRKPNPKISETTTGIAEKVGWIDDLLMQILAHLPLKPLFRFKTVSKHWNSTISDPKFQLMRNQLLQAHSNNRAARGLICQIYYHNSSGIRRFHASLDGSSNRPRPQINNIPQTLTILHSCNGLLVLKNTTSPTYPEYHNYYVYNPTTNKRTPMPLLKDEIWDREQYWVYGMYLVFEPSKSPHYRVVCVWKLDWLTSSTHRCQFDVYSSETGSWKRGRPVDAGYVDFFGGVYWNGAIHWASYVGKCVYFNPDHHDGMTRVMPTLPLCVRYCKNTSHYIFGESFGHLHCAALVGYPYGFRVYEMRRDYSEWFLKYKVDGFSQHLRNMSYTVRHLFCVVRDEEDSFLVLGTGKGEILRYNLVHNTCETMKIKAKPVFDFDTTQFFPYIESPCSI